MRKNQAVVVGTFQNVCGAAGKRSGVLPIVRALVSGRMPQHHLGHRNLQSTALYAALAEGRFAKFWQD